MSVLEWDNLQTFVHDWMKGLQEIVDSIAPDPGADNSMLPLASLPYRFDSIVYSTQYVDNIIDGYSSGDKGYGYQPYVFAWRCTLFNNVIHANSCYCIGKQEMQNPDRWPYLTATDIETIEAERDRLFTPDCINVVNNYPTEKILIKYSNYGNVWFEPQFHSWSDIYIQTPAKNDTTINSRDIGVQFNNMVIDDSGQYVTPYTGIKNFDEADWGIPKTTKCIIVFDNDSDASHLVNDVLATGSANNNVINYSKEGSEYKLYYGDNYLIYALDDSKIYNYHDLFTGTKQATDGINAWNPSAPQIKTPTYNEVKHEDDPPSIVDDDYIDMGLGVETDGMAMYNMAVITRDDLIQLITDFEANADTGLSFIPHVLGLYKLGIESSQLLTTKSEQIKLHKEPNGTSAFTSVDSYNIVKDQLTVIDCGSITIDREELLTNTFYDYSPYSTYEMFIPGCGWITLPDTVVGRTISVSIVFDLTTCSCKGVVRSEGQLLGGSGTTLATVNGIIGSSVPLSINETGLQRAAIFNGSTQAAMALGTAFLGVGIGNPYMGASGVAMAAGALADNHVAGNTTYTNTKGGATDYSVFGDGWKAVLKITRPVVEIPNNYGHTVGFVVNEYGMLSDFHGFTVCVNPHIHISATSDEKEEIKRLLENGVILPDGE